MAKILEPKALAPSDQPWAKQVNARQGAAERNVDRLKTDMVASNKGLAAALAALTQQVSAISEAQAAAAAAQAATAAQVAFLTGQTVFDARTSTFSNISTGSVWGYDPAYDCSVSIMSGSAGRIWVSVTAGCMGSGMGKNPVVGIEASWSGGSRAFINDRWNDASAAQATAARSYMLAVPANTTISIRTRRGATTNNNEQIIVEGVTLSATRL